MEGSGPTVVFDIGEHTTKVGYAAEEGPRAVFRSVIGNSKGNFDNRTYYGDDYKGRNDDLILKNIIEKGDVKCLGLVSDLLNYAIYTNLSIDTEGTSILFTGRPFDDTNGLEDFWDNLFSLGYLNIGFKSQEALALFASGKTTGIVINSGEGLTSVMPIYEGTQIKKGYASSNLAGKDLTELMQVMMKKKGIDSTRDEEVDTIRDIKEKLWFIADKSLDALLKEKSDEDSVKEYYSLPDGTPIQVGYERVKCPELLLNPTYFKSDKTSLLSVFESSCSKVDQHMKKDLLSNIVLAGGSFGFKGMEKRLHYEIKKIIGDKSLFGDQTKILCPPERTYSAWIGGSIVAAMPKTESWISKDDFDEYGREIVQQRLQ